MNLDGYWVDLDKELVTFPRWGINQALAGTLQYNWKGEKKGKHCKETSKYYLINRKGMYAPYGLETLNPELKNIYVVEGAFDALAVRNLGYNCLALLTNNPKHLVSTLNVLRSKGHNIVALCEGDKAGKELAKYGDTALYLPDNEDASSLPQEVLAFILEEMK